MTNVPELPNTDYMREEPVSSTLIHQGRVVGFYDDVIRLPDGRTSHRDILKHPGGVTMAPVLPDGRVVMVQQWRYATGQALLEFPAGKLDTLPTGEKEDPLLAAQRELAEETGLHSEDWESLPAIYTAPGFCDERLWLFIAHNATPLANNPHNPDDDELLNVVTLTKNEAWGLARASLIVDAKTICLLGFLGVFA
ncbi:MAG: NUDIX hydrolase [Vampirovibrionales bacterium]|nr:NUDIX hydrolase [Vampirovibrionales bacterium]